MASRSPAVPGQQDKKVFNKNKKENDQWEHGYLRNKRRTDDPA